MTSPDDQLDGIFSQIAAQDQVDPAVFDQTLEAAFEHTGSGFDDLVPDTDSSASDTDDGDALLLGDHDDTAYQSDDSDTDEADMDTDIDHPDTDYPADDDFLA